MELWTALQQSPVTSVLVGATMLCSLAITLDICQPIDILFTPTLAFQKRQYWRLFTTFLFVGDLSLENTLYQFWMYSISRAIEKQYFIRHSLDYAFTLLVGCIGILVMRSLHMVEMPFLSTMLELMLAYLASRLTPDIQVNVMFFIAIPMRMIPYLLLALQLCRDRDVGKVHLASFAVGHVLWYVLEILPRITGLHLLRVQDAVHALLNGDDVYATEVT